MKNRPVLNIPGSPAEKPIRCCRGACVPYGACLLAGSASIPSGSGTGAFSDAAGEIDRWGSKYELLMLPAVGIALWVGMTVLENIHTNNHMNLTEKDIAAQYRNGRMMVNVLKNECVLLFSYITWRSISVAEGWTEDFGVAFLPVFFTVLFGSMLVFIIRMLRV